MLRKEQSVLIATVAILGYLAWSSAHGARDLDRTPTRARAPELESHAVPDTSLVLPRAREDRGEDARELFAPPSDTRPLPRLPFEPPPLVALPMLRPPPDPGPLPRLFGRFLRAAPATREVKDLFSSDAAPENEPAASAPSDRGASALPGDKSPGDKAERIASYKKLYDWYRIVDLKFGQIRNPDRYGLKGRANEDVLFVEFDPATAQPRLPGQGPIPIKRASVVEFDFADTVENRMEVRRAEFGDPLSAAEYEEALAFGRECVERRLETPRALEIAEEMFQRAARVSNQDPLPHLGLARCYEAGFQYEKAFEEYRALAQGGHERSPLVLMRVAELEARLLMDARAEEHFAEAERYGRASYAVQLAIGRYMRARGRSAEAVPHLVLANQHEPNAPEEKRERAALRVELASALIETGDLAGSREWYTKALQADPSDQRARAGLASVASLARAATDDAVDRGVDGADPAHDGDPSARQDASFDLVLATALESLARDDARSGGTRDATLAEARANLFVAASLDPLRAYLAWRALSYLAEIAGYPEEALRFAELAYENAPSDAWTSYQRGRLLAARDDLDGASESYSRALEREVDFADALAAEGDIQHRRGDFPAAERYFARALAVDESLVQASAMRGVNALEQGDVRAAEEAFRRALAVDVDQPTARNGLAWCAYAKGESEEALTLFRELDDNRRALPEDDPHRAYARAQIARISDHLQKVVWSDRFERRTLLNGWTTEEKLGPQFSIHDGVVTMSGTFKQKGRARMWQAKSAGSFVAFEARITVKSGTTSRVGLFVARETQRASDAQVEAEVTVSRHNEPGKNIVQTRVMKRGEEELLHHDVAGFEWKLDTPVVLRIERSGEAGDTKVRLLLDGFPVLESAPAANLGRTTSELHLGIYAEGEIGRQVNVDVDDVEIVYREAQ